MDAALRSAAASDGLVDEVRRPDMEQALFAHSIVAQHSTDWLISAFTFREKGSLVCLSERDVLLT